MTVAFLSRLRAAAVAVLASVSCLAATPAVAQQIVYSNNFETNADGFTFSTLFVLPTDNAGFGSPNNSQWLGRFTGGGADILNLSGLQIGQTYSLSFDLFIGASWDGNASPQPAGPDRWRLSVVSGGTPTLLVDTTFLNLVPGDNAALSVYNQSYSDTNILGGVSSASNAPFTGADVARTDAQTGLGDPAIYARYAIYYFGHGPGNPDVLFTATSTDVALLFEGIGLQSQDDEFWAIDNVTISSVAPEPTSLALLALGTIAGAVMVQRRRKG
jgi:hypothetical protein